MREGLDRYERRRRPRTAAVLAHTHRRDATRVIPPAIRNRYLRHLGRTMFRANYWPLREPS